MAEAGAVDYYAPGLQWGHGREAMDGRLAPPLAKPGLGFNGATAVRPWMGAG